MERRSIVLGAALLAALGAGRADEAPSGPSSITADALRKDVEYLASDKLEGRDTGTASIGLAEEYVAGAFRRAGLKPVPPRQSWFIDFTVYKTGFDLEHTSLQLSVGEESHAGIAGYDFRPFEFSDDGAVEAPVVFAGYGMTIPELDHDDFAGIEAAGKIVLVLRHTPGEDDPESSFDEALGRRHATFKAKADNARKHGARGMLLVTDPLHHEAGDDLRLGRAMRLEPPEPRDEVERETDAEPFLAIQISRDVARMLVSRSGSTLEELQRAADRGRRPGEPALGDVHARIAVRRSTGVEQIPARDVAGFLEGSDPELAKEWIVIGAHHDHVGAFGGEGDTVFNGADDNASGVSGVLGLAQAFASLPVRPRRSLVFVTFSGEEKGLLGSRALMEHALIPRDRIVFMLNLDMIGRNSDRAVKIYGDGYARGLREIIERANEAPGVAVELEGSGYMGNSDHDPFHDRDVPFAFFFTGTHEDYHQLGDHASKLDYDRMESIVRLAYGMVERLANGASAPEFIHNIDWLGIRAEVVRDPQGDGEARVTAVEDGSRGEAAGLAVGDTLLAFDGVELDDPRRIGEGFRSIVPGTRATILVGRGEETKEIVVERAKRGFLGVYPGAVDEDRREALGLAPGQGFVLLRVPPGGPAARAGLEEGDVVIRIAGRTVGDADLGSRLAQIGAGETVEIRALRGGTTVTLRLTLGEAPDEP